MTSGPGIVKLLIGLELFLSVAAVGGALGMISGVSDLHEYNSRAALRLTGVRRGRRSCW